MPRFHLVLDFDCTLTKFHTHGRYRELAEEDFVDAWLTREIIRRANNLQIPVSICSHGSSRELIADGLRNACALDENYIGAIEIIIGRSGDKLTHMRDALENHKIPKPRNHGALFSRYAIPSIIIDDDDTNVSKAVAEGAVGILVNTVQVAEDEFVPVDNTHLLLILEMIKSPHLIYDMAKQRAEENGYAAVLNGHKQTYVR